jgi:ABC-2 type transport system permease protein
VTARTVVALLRHAWARHRVPLIPIALAIGLFEFALTRFAPAPNEISWMTTMMAAIPPELQKLIGSDAALSTGGFLALGYSHPFFILLLSAWVARTSSAAVAGEVGLGTMDLLASRPVRRWQFVVAGMLTVAFGLAVIVGCAWIATSVGVRMRGFEIPASDFAPLAAAAWLLFSAWGAVGLLISATRRDAGQAIGWTTGVIAASFVLDYVARLWSTIGGVRPLSLFRYYEPQAIFARGVPASTWLVLSATIVLSIAASIFAVQRRDL